MLRGEKGSVCIPEELTIKMFGIGAGGELNASKKA